MKTIVLHGSPRKNGNSDTLARHFLQGLKANGSHEIKHFFANDLNIRPCQGCESCADQLADYCAIKDDMQEIYRGFIEAEIIVFATPMYWGYMTAQLKAVVDRMEAIAHPKYFNGKVFIVLATFRHHVESTVAFFKRIIGYFGGDLHVITCRTVDENSGDDIPISDCKDVLKQAYDLGKSIGSRPIA